MCYNCESRGLECGGYQGFFDRVHRSQSDSIRRKVQRRIASDNASCEGQAVLRKGLTQLVAPKDAAADECDARLHLSAYDVRVRVVASTIPGALRGDFETAASDVFLAIYSRHGLSPRVPGGFMHQMFPMLSRISLDSPLHKAVTAVATTFAVLLSKNPHHPLVPHKNYAQAVRGLRNAILDDHRSRDDDLLMTALMLDFCDSINIHFRVDQDGKRRCHLEGALALMQHRGSANFRNEASKAMMVSLQTGILQKALHAKSVVPAGCQLWFANPQMPHTLQTDLNELTARLTNLLAWSRMCRSRHEWDDNTGAASGILEGLADMDKEFSTWYDELPGDCLPLFLMGDDVPDSLRNAGVYRGVCSVYRDLQVANLLNVWRYRRLMLLHELRECRARLWPKTCGSGIDATKATDDTVQWLADGICESVPFFLGDYTDVVSPVLNSGLTFPTVTNEDWTVPVSIDDHARHATGAGGWLILTSLTNLCRFSKLHDESQPKALREGQLHWIRDQLRRIQYVEIQTPPAMKHADPK